MKKRRKNVYVGVGDTCGDEGTGSIKIDLKMRHKNEREMSPTDDVKRKRFPAAQGLKEE